MTVCMSELQTIDLFRSNRALMGRVLRENGKVKNSEEAIVLTSSYIKQQIGVSLTKEERQKEKQILEIK